MHAEMGIIMIGYQKVLISCHNHPFPSVQRVWRFRILRRNQLNGPGRSGSK